MHRQGAPVPSVLVARSVPCQGSVRAGCVVWHGRSSVCTVSATVRDDVYSKFLEEEKLVGKAQAMEAFRGALATFTTTYNCL